MKQTISLLRHSLARLAILGFAITGCGPVWNRLDTEMFPPPSPAGKGHGLPPAYQNSQDKVNDPRLVELAQQFKTWVLQQRAGANQVPLFNRVEVVPSTQTVLPYGVGAYQQEPRLPAILTTGPGWATLKPEDKEAKVAAAFQDLSGRLEALKLDPSPRPTLTIQMPSGLVLGWINGLIKGRKNLHGDEQ